MDRWCSRRLESRQISMRTIIRERRIKNKKKGR